MANYVKMNNESLNLSDRSIFLNYWTHPSDFEFRGNFSTMRKGRPA